MAALFRTLKCSRTASATGAFKLRNALLSGVIRGLYSGCQNNVPIVGRYFGTTTYAAILFFGTLL
jgi:hypothetical protein